jgi:hypothetical protein
VAAVEALAAVRQLVGAELSSQVLQAQLVEAEAEGRWLELLTVATAHWASHQPLLEASA